MQNNLNLKFWDDFKLKPKVQDALYKISFAFLKFIDIDNSIIKDILLIGSMSNFDYHDKSDIDIHIIVDFSKYGDTKDLMIDLLDAKKVIWNDKHQIKIFGHVVEMYVENSTDPQPSSGKYSILNKKWILKPIKETKKIDKKAISIKCKNLIKKIKHFETLYENDNTSNDLLIKIESFIDQLKEKRKSGIKSYGIFSEDNIIYKYLRKNGYIDILFEIKYKLFDNGLTLEHLVKESYFKK